MNVPEAFVHYLSGTRSLSGFNTFIAGPYILGVQKKNGETPCPVEG
jgi:hypothetical protein